jgi:hypothetical protein
MPTYHFKTEYGTFRVTMKDDIQYLHKNGQIIEEPHGTLLSIGGKNTCVFFNIPEEGDTAHLTNLKTKDGGCEVNDALISGLSTIGMVNLGFTIIRTISPNIKYIKLSDKSDFTCTFQNGMEVGISMTLYEMMFYQESYYEKRYGAYLQNPVLRELYQTSKKGFKETLPEHFSFRNKDLEEILRPIYSESTTWEDFFKKIKPIPNVCQKIFPWYTSAMYEVFKGISFERNEWLIDLYNNPKLLNVNYSVIKKLEGGRKRTRKNDQTIYKYDIYNSLKTYDIPFYDKLYDIKYRNVPN